MVRQWGMRTPARTGVPISVGRRTQILISGSPWCLPYPRSGLAVPHYRLDAFDAQGRPDVRVTGVYRNVDAIPSLLQ